MITPTRKWKPYPAYKDSGVEWLNEVPAHWRVYRLKSIATVQASNVDKKWVESEQPVRLCNYVDVYYHDHITKDIEFLAATASREQVARFSLRRGDVIITKDSESWTDIAIAAFVPNDLEGVVCGYHLALVRPAPELVDGAYLSRGFAAAGIRDQFHVAANGITRYGLSKDSIDSAVFPVPPLAEQRAIAAFLDRETAEIDALIAKKERLIKLLQEKRAALITHAVTNGLDHSAPMKPSGVKWLGQIPAGWGMRRLKFMSSLVTSGSRGWAQHYSDGGAVFLRIGNLSRTGIDLQLDDVQYVDPPEGAEGRRTRVAADDLLVSITAYIGSVGVVPEGMGEAYVNQHLALTRLRREVVEPRWAAYCLLSHVGQPQFNLLLYGGTKDGLGLDDVKDLVVLLPRQAEQTEIVREIDREIARVGDLIAKVRDGIARLREYRVALISAAVTGKIDVREETA